MEILSSLLPPDDSCDITWRMFPLPFPADETQATLMITLYPYGPMPSRHPIFKKDGEFRQGMLKSNRFHKLFSFLA